MSDSRPSLVLMAGFSGAGKTTLAVQLNRELKWLYIDRDGIKDKLLRENMEEKDAPEEAYKRALDKAYRALEEKASVILDSSARYLWVVHKSLEIVRSTNAQLKVILCITDRQTLNKRSGTNRDCPNTLEEYLKCYEHLPSDTLKLDTTRSLKEYLPIAINYLQG